MQRERTSLDSFPEVIDLNEGSFAHNFSFDHLNPWDNMVNPVENRMSNYMLSPTDANGSCTKAKDNSAQSFNGRDQGESSSSANNLQERAHGNGMDMSLGWSSSFYAYSGTDPRSNDWSFEQSNQVTNRSPSNTSHGATLNIGASRPHNLYKSGHSEMDPEPNSYASSSYKGNRSGISGTYTENNDSLGLSFGTWGSSSKRKAHEGISGQFCPGGSSRSIQPMDNIMQQSVPNRYTAPRNLSVSPCPLNLSPTSQSGQLHLRSTVGTSRAAPSFFPSSIAPGIVESAARNFTIRSNAGHQDAVPFDTARSTSVRYSAAQHILRPISNIESADSRSTMTMPMNPNIITNQPHLYPWNGSFSSHCGSWSSSLRVLGESGEEVSNRSSFSNNSEIVSAPRTRNIPQDQIDWSFTPGNSLSSRNYSSGSRMGPTPREQHSSSPLLPHQIPTSQNHQRFLEAVPCFPYPHIESDSGIWRSQFEFFPSGSSSSDESAHTNHTQHQSDHIPARYLMDMPGDDHISRRVLAAVEGRHRVIRQVLSAMQRGVRLRAEDYMLTDPFTNGYAEVHDRHRALRLDVDDMSYEELLALEERIGNVSTGLTKEKIRSSMNQRKHEGMRASPNLEPCCICQENYNSGDYIGILDCGHEFHTSCIKQWLLLKNLCPICKMMALKS